MRPQPAPLGQQVASDPPGAPPNAQPLRFGPAVTWASRLATWSVRDAAWTSMLRRALAFGGQLLPRPSGRQAGDGRSRAGPSPRSPQPPPAGAGRPARRAPLGPRRPRRPPPAPVRRVFLPSIGANQPQPRRRPSSRPRWPPRPPSPEKPASSSTTRRSVARARSGRRAKRSSLRTGPGATTGGVVASPMRATTQASSSAGRKSAADAGGRSVEPSGWAMIRRFLDRRSRFGFGATRPIARCCTSGTTLLRAPRGPARSPRSTHRRRCSGETPGSAL